MKLIRAGFAVITASVLLMSWPARADPFAPFRMEDGGERVVVTSPVTDNSELFERLGDAAENGDVDAMNVLGALFASNARVPSDYTMALYWLQRAIDGGSVDAMHNIAYMYLRGLGVSRDYANAFGWFRRAADGGNAYAMHSVATMAENGVGTERDLSLARSMYRKAAESGMALAMIWVSEDFARGGASQDLVAAYSWLEVAALSPLDGQLQLVLLVRIEELGSRLGPVKRDEARSRAGKIVAALRSRSTPQAAPRQSSPGANRRFPSA